MSRPCFTIGSISFIAPRTALLVVGSVLGQLVEFVLYADEQRVRVPRKTEDRLHLRHDVRVHRVNAGHRLVVVVFQDVQQAIGCGASITARSNKVILAR